MANDCLVTKLKAEIANDNLPYLDYLTVNVRSLESATQYTNGFKMMYDSNAPDSTLIIKGNGHFTNASMSSDLGTEATVAKGVTSQGIVYSNGDYQLLIPIKGMKQFVCRDSSGYSNDWNLEGFDYSRLLAYKEIVTVAIRTADELLDINNTLLGDIQNIIIARTKTSETFTADRMYEHIVSSGRTSDFSLQIAGFKDAYSINAHSINPSNPETFNATRNIKEITSTQFKVYNAAGTGLLCTYNLSGGVWIPTPENP